MWPPVGVRMLLVNRGDIVYGSLARANGWNVARRVDTWVDPYIVMVQYYLLIKGGIYLI